jgi:Ulp1 family protease
MSSTRNVYAQTLRRAGIDVSDEVVEEVQPKLYSQRFREAQVLLEKAYAESAINITPREEVSARSPIQMPAIVFDEPVPMEIEDVDETQDLTEIFIASRLRPLESHELQSIEALIRGHSNDEVLIDKFNIPFKRKDCVTLRDGQWLNDECINFYMQMLKQRDEELCKLNAKRVPSHFFNSFFIKRLLDDEGGKYSYGNVKRWTKKFDVFASNKLFFPVNISNTHWTLAVVFMRLKRICYFDSMAGKGTRYLQGLQRWASDEHKDKKGTELDDAAFELVPCNRNTTPQQMNGVDCGVFTTMFADFLSDDLDLMEFQQVNIPMFRRKIGHFILQGTLDYPLQ